MYVHIVRCTAGKIREGVSMEIVRGVFIPEGSKAGWLRRRTTEQKEKGKCILENEGKKIVLESVCWIVFKYKYDSPGYPNPNVYSGARQRVHGSIPSLLPKRFFTECHTKTHIKVLTLSGRFSSFKEMHHLITRRKDKKKSIWLQ